MHQSPAKTISLVNLFFFAFSLVSYAATFQASLNIVTPIVLVNTTQLDLGSIIAGNNSETCAVGIGGVRTGAACFGSENGNVGVISVAGVEGEIIDISLSGSSFSGMINHLHGAEDRSHFGGDFSSGRTTPFTLLFVS